MALVKHYALLLPDSDELSELTLPFNDLEELCEHVLSKKVAYFAFFTDEISVENGAARIIEVDEIRILEDIQIQPDHPMKDSEFWSDVFMPMLCNYFETDEVNSFTFIELSEETLKVYGFLDRLNE